jgi:hypothetical protein
MMEGTLRRDDLDESMNDINLDEWKNLMVLYAAAAHIRRRAP